MMTEQERKNLAREIRSRAVSHIEWSRRPHLAAARDNGQGKPHDPEQNLISQMEGQIGAVDWLYPELKNEDKS